VKSIRNEAINLCHSLTSSSPHCGFVRNMLLMDYSRQIASLFFLCNRVYSNFLIATSRLQLSVLRSLSQFLCSIYSGFYMHAPSASERESPILIRFCSSYSYPTYILQQNILKHTFVAFPHPHWLPKVLGRHTLTNVSYFVSYMLSGT